MPAKKIVNEQEVVRWIREGKTYAWMVDEYLFKYHVEISATAFSNFRRRRGLDARISRDAELVPWAVNREHRHQYPVAMLRFLARRREGRPLTAEQTKRLDAWLTRMKGERLVVDYDPAIGFVEVPRHDDDDELVRQPHEADRRRRS